LLYQTAFLLLCVLLFACRSQKPGRALVLGLLAAAAAIAACIALYVSGHASSLQAYLVNGPLGRNGMLAAFCLIFLSELGDKTFFIAALLAMKLGRWISFVGSLAALAVMTLISVGIGAAFCKVPDALKSSLPVGEIAGVALLVFFGIKALKVRRYDCYVTCYMTLTMFILLARSVCACCEGLSIITDIVCSHRGPVLDLEPAPVRMI
jgi:hypothetical protein